MSSSRRSQLLVPVGLSRRTISTAVVYALLAVVVVAAGAVAFLREEPVPAWQDYLARSSIAGRTEVRVGVSGIDDIVAGKVSLSAFETVLIRYLGGSLGAEVALVPLRPDERLEAVRNGSVDLAIGGISLTEERVRSQAAEFAGPYLRDRPTLLVRAGLAGDAEQILTDERTKVCLSNRSTTFENVVRARGGRAQLQYEGDFRLCLDALLKGTADAVAGASSILLPALTKFPGLRPVPLPGAEVSYYIAVAPRDFFLQQLVQSFLIASRTKHEAGAWAVAYQATLGGVAGLSRTQPDVSGVPLRNAGDRPPGGVLPPPAGLLDLPWYRNPRSPQRVPRRRGRRARRRPPPAAAVSHSVRRQDEPGASAPMNPPDRQGLWSLLVGVPAAVCALYLWVQSGGDRQFTLLLAQAVDPISFLATVLLAALWLLLAGPAMLFAVCGVVLGSVSPTERDLLSTRHPILARVSRVPRWAVVATIVGAAVCCPLMFVPAWILTLCMALRVRLMSPRCVLRPAARTGACVAFVVTTLIMCWMAAAADHHWFVVIAVVPLVALAAGADAPVRRSQATALIRVAWVVLAILSGGTVVDLVSRPILPSTVVTVVPAADARSPDAAGEGATADADDGLVQPPRFQQLRGYMLSTDDLGTTILLDAGGIVIVDNDDIRDRVSCPSASDLPSRATTPFGLTVDDSLLRQLARTQRPAVLEDPRCLLRTDAWPGT